MYKLVIQDDEGKTTVVPLIRDELTIGRKEGNTIRLTERNVSRRHARLVRQNGSITIEDLNSYNGIRVNGSRIQGRCQIRETDRVQIGDYLIELKSESHEKASETLSERTIPIERIDPHATTPVPESVEPGDSAVATTRMSKAEAAVVMGAGFVPAVSEPIPPIQDGEQAPAAVAPGAPPVSAPTAVPITHAVAHARLVVLSTNLAGREFDLDKPAMVIGRTEDNDICINHRSISRHHAKIVRENGRHAIVDLQSSNGVRVNGEEYGKVELRRADVIDLGHVRLRFVEAGEDFLFGRDAQAIDLAPPSSSRMAVWIALALLVLGGAVVLFLLFGRGEDGGEAVPGDLGSAQVISGPNDPSHAAGAAATGTPDGGARASVVDPAAEAPMSDEVSKHLQAAREAVIAEKWNDALTHAKAALEADPGNGPARGLVDQAQSELASEGIYKQFSRAVTIRDYKSVAELFRRFDPESVYRVKALPDHDRLKADYIKLHSREGKRLADRGKCQQQEKLAAELSRVWVDAGRAVTSFACKQPSQGGAVANTPPGGTEPSGDGGTTEAPGGAAEGDPAAAGGPPGGASGAVPAGTFDQLLEQSRLAAAEGQYAKSLRFCELAIEKRATDQIAAVTCGVAACRLKSAPKARKFIRKISSATRQQQVQQICLQEGVTDI